MTMVLETEEYRREKVLKTEEKVIRRKCLLIGFNCLIASYTQLQLRAYTHTYTIVNRPKAPPT
jgi:hypothetical protein